VCMLLPIGIMAHNEEAVIGQAISSALGQDCPAGFSVKIFVVANACSDGTERIVHDMAMKEPERVVLISTVEKGKTRAVNRFISLLRGIEREGVDVPYVIFLDADCIFERNEEIIKFVSEFERFSGLEAIGATCVPDVVYNHRSDLIGEVYRAVYQFSIGVRVNFISGMCYGIRFESLKKLDFPDFQSSDDRWVCARLNGRFYKDPDIRIVYRSPRTLRSEIRRKTRQLVYHEKYRQLYSRLKRKGIRIELFNSSLGENYRWGRTNGRSFLLSWYRLAGLKVKLYFCISILIRLFAKVSAYPKVRRLDDRREIDYWRTDR
jgi:glycosyltransferase involved in cell wall biosynthesis